MLQSAIVGPFSSSVLQKPESKPKPELTKKEGSENSNSTFSLKKKRKSRKTYEERIQAMKDENKKMKSMYV